MQENYACLFVFIFNNVYKSWAQKQFKYSIHFIILGERGILGAYYGEDDPNAVFGGITYVYNATNVIVSAPTGGRTTDAYSILTGQWKHACTHFSIDAAR